MFSCKALGFDFSNFFKFFNFPFYYILALFTFHRIA